MNLVDVRAAPNRCVDRVTFELVRDDGLPADGNIAYQVEYRSPPFLDTAGRTVAVDATTLEANAAMRSIVRRDTGETYQAFLTRLAQESGIKTPTREALARLDRRRKKRTSNTDWHNPSDPDAKITKMKDGRTHLAHKAEHAIDLDSGALVAVTVHGAHIGDTTSLGDTVMAAIAQLAAAADVTLTELVADKGYDADWLRELLFENDVFPCIPTLSTRKEGFCVCSPC